MNTLKESHNYITDFPAKMLIPENTERLIITDNLTDCDIHLEANAHLTFVALLTKGWEEKKFLKFIHQGAYATTNFIAMIIAKDRENFAFETISKHEAPRTNAYYHTRAAQFDYSHVAYRGVLVIDPGAQITDSYLAHHTLMLSRDAKTETIPSLEIEADDVKAGHAATIGRVDEETLHYVQSRGLTREQATEVMIRGFIEADLHRIHSEEVRLMLSKEIENKLNA